MTCHSHELTVSSVGIGAWRTKVFLVVHLLKVVLYCEALAQWRSDQRSQQLAVLRDDELASLARQTDINTIRSLLRPILVERIVGTPQHDLESPKARRPEPPKGNIERGRQGYTRREKFRYTHPTLQTSPDLVANYLKRKAEEYGFTTEWDSFYDNTPMGRKPFHNVIATYDPMVHRRLVLACHYDSKILPGQVFIAATDSAVPCAIILDIARLLAPLLHSRTNKHITLQLLFLDGEEAFDEWTATDSIYGARHLAQIWASRWYPTTSGSAFELSKEIDRVDAMMLLDLLGTADPFPQVTSSYGHGTTQLFQNLPDIENKLRRLSALRPLPNIFRTGSTYAQVEDDHIPFMTRGVPIMHIISVPFPRAWHTPADNESALNYDVIHNIATVIRVFVARYLGVHPPSG